MDRIDMATQLVLITASPADSWVQQISDMASKGVVELAILAPEQVAPGLTGPDFDVALVDASSMTVMKEIVAALRARSAAKIIVVTNGVDMKRFSPRQKDAELERDLEYRNCFVAGYIGTHGMAHGLQTLLEAMHRLQHQPGATELRLMLLGDGAQKRSLQEEAKRLDLRNVRFVDTVSKDQVARYWSLLDVSIIHLRRTELFTTVIPSKLFECMGMGIPVLLGVEGESADIVEKEGAGIAFEPENVDALVGALLKVSTDLALRKSLQSQALAGATHYDRQILANQMLSALRQLPRP